MTRAEDVNERCGARVPFSDPGRYEPRSISGAGSAWRTRWRSDQGVALLLVLLSLLLFLAVTGVLVMLTSTETRIAGAEQARQMARGAAEVALERGLQELAEAADWSVILAGAARASFADPGAPPPVGEWGALDLVVLTNRVQRDADAANRWGADGPIWRVFGWGALATLLDTAPGASPGTSALLEPPIYVVVWVADDEGEGDGNPAADTNQMVSVRADAFGPFRSRQALQATVRRRGGGLELVSWRPLDGM